MTKRTDPERAYPCAYCGAVSGQACLTPQGKHAVSYHLPRINAWIAAEVEDVDPEERLAGLTDQDRDIVARLAEGQRLRLNGHGVFSFFTGERGRQVSSARVRELRAQRVIWATERRPPGYGLTPLGERIAALLPEEVDACA